MSKEKQEQVNHPDWVVAVQAATKQHQVFHPDQLAPKPAWYVLARSILVMLNDNRYVEALQNIQQLVEQVERSIGKGKKVDLILVLAQCLDENKIGLSVCDNYIYKLLALKDNFAKVQPDNQQVNAALDVFVTAMHQIAIMLENPELPVSEVYFIQRWLEETGILSLPVLDIPDVAIDHVKSATVLVINDFFKQLVIPNWLGQVIDQVAIRTDNLPVRISTLAGAKSDVTPGIDGTVLLPRHGNGFIIRAAYGSRETKMEGRAGAERTNGAFTGILERINKNEVVDRSLTPEAHFVITSAVDLLFNFQTIYQKIVGLQRKNAAVAEAMESTSVSTIDGPLLEFYQELFWLEKAIANLISANYKRVGAKDDQAEPVLAGVWKKFQTRVADYMKIISVASVDHVVYQQAEKLISIALSTELLVFSGELVTPGTTFANSFTSFRAALTMKSGVIDVVYNYETRKSLQKHRQQSATFFKSLIEAFTAENTRDKASLHGFIALMIAVSAYVSAAAKNLASSRNDEVFLTQVVTWFADQFGLQYDQAQPEKDLTKLMVALQLKIRQLVEMLAGHSQVPVFDRHAKYLTLIHDDLADFLCLPLQREHQTVKSAGPIKSMTKHTSKIEAAFGLVTLLVSAATTKDWLAFFQKVVAPKNGTIAMSRDKGKKPESRDLEKHTVALRDAVVKKLILTEQLSLTADELLEVAATLATKTMVSALTVTVLDLAEKQGASIATLTKIYELYLQHVFAPLAKINDQAIDLEGYYQQQFPAITVAVGWLIKHASKQSADFADYEATLKKHQIEVDFSTQDQKRTSTTASLTKRLGAATAIAERTHEPPEVFDGPVTGQKPAVVPTESQCDQSPPGFQHDQ